MQFSMQTVLGLVTAFAFIGVVCADSHGGCPADHGCFFFPEGCSPGTGQCFYEYSWMVNDAGDAIDFKLKVFNNQTTARWVAIGFDDDGDMVS